MSEKKLKINRTWIVWQLTYEDIKWYIGEESVKGMSEKEISEFVEYISDSLDLFRQDITDHACAAYISNKEKRFSDNA